MLGGHAVAQCLRNEGVKHVFSVPATRAVWMGGGLS
jgi:thiamine pyrophosphate-dependent acetolactate synthase large subunit-like protein